MIKEKEINVNIVGRNVNKYLNLGYDCKVGDNINIKIKDIPLNSHSRITAICDKCGEEHDISFQKYNKNIKNQNFYTCKKCSNIKAKITNINKYGYESPLQNENIYNKLKQTNIDKYGVENTFQFYEFKEKIKSTNQEKYGVYYPQQNKLILEKSNITNLKKYGVNRPAQNIDIQEKCKDTKMIKYGNPFFNNLIKIKGTNFERYNVDNVSKLSTHKDNIQIYHIEKLLIKYKFINSVDYSKSIYCCKCKKNHNYEIDIKLFHNRIYHNINTCTICYPENTLSSIKEKELLNFIRENYNDVIFENDRKILSGKELDILIPKLNLAFEFNGLYWHSNIYKDDNYHFNKTLNCINKGIQVIHIWEDDWTNNNKNIKKMIIEYLNDDTILYDLNNIKIESSYLNNNILEKYHISDVYPPKKWNIKNGNRYKYNEKSNLPYICDCGYIKLIKNND